MLLFVVSCATSYQPKGFSGGYHEEQVGADLYEVTFSGNAYTGRERVQRYLKRRCAELAMSKGFTHYVIVDSSREGRDKKTNQATIKLLKNPGADVAAIDAKMVLKNTAD